MSSKLLAAASLLLFLCSNAHAGLFDSVTRNLGTITKAAKATEKAARPISEEEEYYVGRAVAARIVATYPLLKNPGLTEYVNSIGRTLSLHSEKPYTYGGYHFAILDSDEMNAFACPGGIIFITRGMLRAAENEEELAAVLAHEIAHINNRDGISSIKSSRWTEALTVIGSSAAKQYSSREVAQLVGIFEGSIDDIVKTLVVNGYSKSQEYAADKASIAIAQKAGYSSSALYDLLGRMAGRSTEGGITKTHPDTSDRIDNIKDLIKSRSADPSSLSRRTDRFRSAPTTR